MNNSFMTSTVDSASDLWPPNWSQFMPDVLVGLITGVVIGFALDFVQRRRSRRDEVRDAQRSWDRLQSRLRVLFEERPKAQVDSWTDNNSMQAIAEEVADHPIQDWGRLLQDEAIRALVGLERNYIRLARRAQVLDEALGPVIRELRPDTVPRSNLMERHREVERAARAFVFGLDLSTARIGFEKYNLTDSELLLWVQHALQDERVAIPLKRFNELRIATDSKFEIIARVFALADGVDA